MCTLFCSKKSRLLLCLLICMITLLLIFYYIITIPFIWISCRCSSLITLEPCKSRWKTMQFEAAFSTVPIHLTVITVIARWFLVTSCFTTSRCGMKLVIFPPIWWLLSPVIVPNPEIIVSPSISCKCIPPMLYRCTACYLSSYASILYAWEIVGRGCIISRFPLAVAKCSHSFMRNCKSLWSCGILNIFCVRLHVHRLQGQVGRGHAALSLSHIDLIYVKNSAIFCAPWVMSDACCSTANKCSPDTKPNLSSRSAKSL